MTNQLRSIYDRWYRLEEEKQAISDDLKDLFAEAKANGYDGKALRAAFRIKAMSSDEAAKRDEQDALVDLYLAGLSGTGSATRTPASRAKADTAPLPPEHKATPVVVADPAPRQEQAGTDTSLDDEAGAADDPALVATTAKPATAAKEAAGTHPDDDEGIPTWLQRGHPDCVVREQGRG